MTDGAVQKKLPIGIENFEKIRTDNFYYIDKTRLIRDLLHNWGEVNLFTRPRRFGKTLNMSMLKNFFEIGCRRELFDGLAISEETELCEEYMGKFPVIAVSLKSVNGNDYETAREMMCSVIGNEAMRFQFLAESSRLTEKEKRMYDQLTAIGRRGEGAFKMSDTVLMGSLYTLSALLRKHYGSRVIILIDEYDVPLAKASENGYYDQMVLLLRNVFERALKTNDNLYFAVLTGCLRVAAPSPLGSKIPRQVDEAGFPAKLENTSLSSQCQSIFTGLNNFNVMTITDVGFEEYFGFTDEEVKELLDYYDFSEAFYTVKEWYDGYQFGKLDVYCPWDVICYCGRLKLNSNAQPEAFWSNTSSNMVIRHFLESARSITKQEIERLISGESIVKAVRQELTYKDMYASVDNVWSVLFTTGYLTQRGEPVGNKLRLAIPNREIRNIFEEQITEWFQDSARKDGTALNSFCEAFKSGDAAGAEKKFNEYLNRTISIRDTAVKNEMKENYFHGILLGLLSYKDDWYVASNRESGDGDCDILVEIDGEEIGIAIEVKYAENGELDAACRRALRQIEERRYAAQLREDGMRKILKYGVACWRKKCRIMLEEGQAE